MTRQVLAITCGDLHIGPCPSARSAEPSWPVAMWRGFQELQEVQNAYQVPILCSGDIVDLWNTSNEVVNWAIKNLPVMVSICGNHDLPNHRLDQVHRSAYHTLVECGIIKDIREPVLLAPQNQLVVHPFPWGSEIKPLKRKDESKVHVALIHKMIWMEGHTYHGAKDEDRVGKFWKRLEGYDIAVFGDNHSPWMVQHPDGRTIFNGGTFFRRKMNEIDYKPMLGLIYSDGAIEPHYLDVSEDKFVERSAAKTKTSATEPTRSADFLEGLVSLERDSLDFVEIVRRRVERSDVHSSVRELVLHAIQ